MKKKQINRWLFIFFTINIALLGIYGYLLFVVESKNKETSVLYATSHQVASDKEKIQELERVLKDTEGDRDKLSQYFIAKTNAVTFIEQIEKIGKTAGVDLSVSSVSDDEKDRNSIQLNFSATGSFLHLYHLIALIESMPYKVVIKKADIQVGANGSPEVTTPLWEGSFVVLLEGFITGNVAQATGVASKN